MNKVTITGPGAAIIGRLIYRALNNSGLKVNHWYDVTPKAVPNCRRDATREGADISIVSMSKGSRK